MNDMHAAALLSNRARLTPNKEALLELETGRRFSYAELNARANRVANFMREGLNVQAGDRVSILADNGVAYLDLFYGLAKIGAIFAPLNWRLADQELAYIVNDCQPKVLVYGAEYADLVTAMRPQIDVAYFVTLTTTAVSVS